MHPEEDKKADTTALRLSEEQRQFIRRASYNVVRGEAKESDREVNEAAIERLYAATGLHRPLFFYADNPLQLMQMAFLLQTAASVPHGSRRKQLSRSRICMPAPELAWRLSDRLSGEWRLALNKLMEQLTAAGLEKLADDSHHDCVRVSYYAQPDLLTTCGSRLGFPIAPALSNLYDEVARNCLGHIWQTYSTAIAREFVTLIQEHKMQRFWRQRAAVEMAIVDGDPYSAHLIPGFVRDLERETRCSPLPAGVRCELADSLDQELLLELLLLQDTRCYHERVDGTSALKPAAHTQQLSSDPGQRLVDACSNRIYMLNWGCWLQDDLYIWKAAQSLFGSGLYPERLATLLNDFLTTRANGFVYIFASRAVFVCPNPTRIDWDHLERLHNWSEPAIEFADGSGWQFWRGIYITPERDERLRVLNVETIDQEPNVELRRVLIERFGAPRYLEESGVKPFHSDRFGTLYRKDIAGDEQLVMVRVRNSTKEPDGSFKHYYLRVPPHVQTAREAVAWTFGMQHGEYNPTRQS